MTPHPVVSMHASCSASPQPKAICPHQPSPATAHAICRLPVRALLSNLRVPTGLRTSPRLSAGQPLCDDKAELSPINYPHKPLTAGGVISPFRGAEVRGWGDLGGEAARQETASQL